MSKHRLVSVGREGFTLAEMLVAMALLAVLAAIVVPSILRQVGKGDATRVANDLRSVSEAAQSYYADKFAWPDNLDSLAVSSGSAAYLAIPQFTSGDSIVTGGNGVIQNAFEGDSVVIVNHLTTAIAAKVDSLVDGDKNFSASKGRVTYTAGTNIGDPATDFKYYIR